MTIGERLKEERNRLDLTQTALATSCGVGKRAQINYEANEQIPGGAYLAGAAGMGIDVAYVLTGHRAGSASREEVLLLSAYRGASDEVKRIVQAALGAADRAPSPRAAANAAKFTDNKIGQAFTGSAAPRKAVVKMAGDKIKKKSR